MSDTANTDSSLLIPGTDERQTTALRFDRHLTVGAWESEFKRRGVPLTGPRPQSGPQPTPAPWAAAAALHLDFSRVEFVDFGVLARTLLVLDAAVRAKLPATISLPMRAATNGEQEAIRRLIDDGHPEAAAAHRRMKRNARRRGEARDFMRDAGFLGALRAPHWTPGAVRLLDIPVPAPVSDEQFDDPYADEGLADGGRDDASEFKPSARRVLPLRWVPSFGPERTHHADHVPALEAGLLDLGLPRSDAHAIGQTILAELIENVARHAGTTAGEAPHALVGAILMDPDTYAERLPAMGAPHQFADLADHAVETNSRALRVVVGDSGVGLMANPAVSPETSAEDHLLTLIGAQPRSTAQPDAASPTQPDRRGFVLVSRIVDSYRGHISVRTHDLVGDLVFGGAREQTARVRGGFASLPGTLLEALVLTGSRESRPVRLWEEHCAVHQNHTMHWLGCALDAQRGLAPADVERLEAVACTAGPEHDAIGVVITVSIRDALKHSAAAATQEALRQAIAVIGRVTARTAAAIVFPDADRHLLDLAVSGMHHSEHSDDGAASAALAPSRCVLVMGASGYLAWCGGTASVCALLDAMTTAGGVLSLDRARDHLTTTGDVADGLDHLVVAEDGNLILCVSPRQIMSVLSEAVGRLLADEITGDGHGVVRGRFRTPSLHITDRWIDIARLLTGTVGFDVAAFMLARAVEGTMASLPPTKGALAVAQAATCPRELATRLSECLSLGGRSYPMASELDRDGWPTGGEVPDGARVVLCADVISTENTVRRAAAAVIRNAEPVAIVCIVDGRADRKPIKVLNWVIPVIALVETTLDEMPPDRAIGPFDAIGTLEADASETGTVKTGTVDIDPISRRPAPRLPAEPQLITEDEILDWCVADPGTLRLGHIERHRHNHFSAYLQVDRLLRRDSVRARITLVYCQAVEAALARLRKDGHDGDSIIEVWHPGDPDDYAGRLAEAVRACLASRGHDVGRTVPVPRLVAGSRWQTVPVTPYGERPPSTVIVIDWGALTTTTINQLILTAANCGARAIVGVVLLNQLAAHDQGLLGAISAVSAAPGSPSVPVVIRFLTQSSIAELPLYNCAICATRAKYAEIANLPVRLQSHVERLRELLRPRDREEVFQTAPTDLFNTPISSQDAADYLRWRGLVQVALRDTGARQEVVDKLRALKDGRRLPGWSRSSLLRLLAAEQQWLKLPPLRFAVSRDLLAAICLAELHGPTAAPPWLCAQVVMVLSTAAPEHFVDLLPVLLNLLIDEPVAIEQLCVDCYRLLRRPLYDSPIVVSQLRDRLLRCRDDLEQLQIGSDRKVIDDYLELFRDLVREAEHPSALRTGGAQASWANLLEDLCRPVIRHRFEAAPVRVRDFLEDLPETRPNSEQLKGVRSDWEQCVRQLEELALPHLPALRDILAGDYVADQLGKHEQNRLVELTRPGHAALHAATDRLSELLQRPWNPEDGAWSESHSTLLREVNWWYHAFLATHCPDTSLPAHVVQFVNSAPVGLGAVVSESVRTHSSRIEADLRRDSGAEARVFCPRGLLEETVGHVLDNIWRHRVPGGVPRLDVGYRKPGPNTIVTVLRNSDTRPSMTPGHGLRSLAARLRPFGGFVRGTELSAEGWTYETAITLQLWQGA